MFLLMRTSDIAVGKILFIRGNKVMIDRDLAILYGVDTRTLNQAVKRNMKLFPEDCLRMTFITG